MRDQLILPAYVALETFRAGTDPDAIVSARHSLAACLDYMGVACRLAGRPREALQAIDVGMVALVGAAEAQAAVETLAAETAGTDPRADLFAENARAGH